MPEDHGNLVGPSGRAALRLSPAFTLYKCLSLMRACVFGGEVLVGFGVVGVAVVLPGDNFVDKVCLSGMPGRTGRRVRIRPIVLQKSQAAPPIAETGQY